MKTFTKRVPVYFLFIAAFIGALASYSFTSIFKKAGKAEQTEVASNIQSNISSSCNFDIKRLAGRKFIRPLLFAERACEDECFASIKSSVSGIIDNLKAKGDVNSASVYIRLFKEGKWMTFNEEAKFQPGSLFKVPLLITYLRLSEEKPGFLNNRVSFNATTEASKGLKQEFLKDAIKLGNTYSFKELLTYMIAHSDNNATMLLMTSIPFTEFQKTFTDLGLSKDLTKNDAVISAKEYSSFWITLYNGSYLNFDNSEYALTLLSQSDFSEGITKNIPKDVKVAHKFGEKGDATKHAFSETGIIYANNVPYLISIMTEGKDQSKLPSVIQDISTAVYNNIQGMTQ
jgi:beta-lactamase class A